MKYLLTHLIKLYQRFLSPILPFNQCRFYPTCSQYMLEAINKWGICKGMWLGTKRVGRCHPFSRHSGYDPVP
ncbi:MAG: membrane protein insertion efficiency factor YidD [Bacteroidetes bacterium]|nr:membrane protein insertion efficiency factor YidD [Bacteroidota bacterium]